MLVCHDHILPSCKSVFPADVVFTVRRFSVDGCIKYKIKYFFYYSVKKTKISLLLASLKQPFTLHPSPFTFHLKINLRVQLRTMFVIIHVNLSHNSDTFNAT